MIQTGVMRIRSLGGVICCGNISLDMPVWPVERIAWGTTLWVEEIEQNIGGNGGNTSIALARLGTPVRLYGTVGSDARGDQLLAQLRREGVDATRVARSQLETTSVVCLVHPSGDRMFLHRPGASRDLDPGRLRFDDGPAFTHFHFANPFALPVARYHAQELFARARAAGLTTSLDTGWDSMGRWGLDVDSCLPDVDLLFVNESEAEKLTGLDDPDAAARALQDRGAAEVVIKLGGRGCVVYAEAGRMAIPAFAVEVKDTTGAGDCFAGGFLAALHHLLDLRGAAAVANAVGAMSVERLGTVAGVKSWHETQSWMAGARAVAGPGA
jgi:sugar/nucleoside kinase (ribokinase family)